MWQDCFVISFSCKLNRSDEREPHHGDSLSCYLYLFGLSLLRTLQQHDMLNPYGYGEHIHARRWKHIKDWLSFVGTYRL